MAYSAYDALPFYPGPVTVHPEIAKVMYQDFAPPRFGMEYTELYIDLAQKIQKMCNTDNEAVFPTGEAMVCLWGALKSCLKPGDKVVTVGTGVFGDGFADMAESLGCKVEKISLPYNSTITPESLVLVDEAIKRCNPVMITAVHCETPSGTLNPLEELGKLKKDRGVPLFVVDAVASMGGAPIDADKWNCDILLGGSQKCFSCPPFMGIMLVSDTAWEIAEKVNYLGYDGMLPFHKATENPMKFPYTPCWMGIKGLHKAVQLIEQEGIENVYRRHKEVAKACRHGLNALGIALWTAPNAVNSPTCTAAMIPDGFDFKSWKAALAEHGMYIAGSFGPMDGKVFRIGHMGTQAYMDNMEKALNVIKEVLQSR